jgi:hypothetical protein
MPQPDPTHAAVMVAQILKLQSQVPFEPFVVLTSDGRAFEVPTPDHVTVTRLLRRVEIEGDVGYGATINPLHIASVQRRTDTAA